MGYGVDRRERQINQNQTKSENDWKFVRVNGLLLQLQLSFILDDQFSYPPIALYDWRVDDRQNNRKLFSIKWVWIWTIKEKKEREDKQGFQVQYFLKRGSELIEREYYIFVL